MMRTSSEDRAAGGPICDKINPAAKARDSYAMTQLPLAKILSRPDIAFYSAEASPGHFDVGFMSGPSFLVQARVELAPQQSALLVRLASETCDTRDAASNSGVLALEHLYGIVLASGVETTFRVEVCNGDGRCTPRLAPGSSQYAALIDIAKLRDDSLTEVKTHERYKKWSPLQIVQAKADHESVSARILGHGKPAVGHVVAFAQAPHLGCFSKTNDAGIAACELEDYHGDDEHDHEAEQFIVTLTGGVNETDVVPPMSRSFKR